MTRPVCSALVLSLFLALSASAFANSGELLNFQGLGNLQQVGNFYDGSGISGTPNYGVTFSSNFYGLRTTASGWSGNFAATPLGTPAIFICPGGPPSCGGTSNIGVINSSSGFSNGLDFYFAFDPSKAGQTVTLTVWSGANGTGSVLATISLSSNACASSPYYCTWTQIGQSFSGTAHSVTFSGATGNQLGLTDITLGSSTTAIPEPSSFYLLAVGAAGISLGALRRFARS
jgi:hypothetical protein